MPKFSKGEAIRFGWSVMKANLKFFIGLLLIVFLISFLAPYLQELFLKQKPPPVARILLYIFGIMVWILQIIINFNFLRIAIKFAKGETAAYSDLFQTENIIKYVAGGVLYFLVTVAGFFLLIVPGIIWAIKYQFYAYFVAEQGMGARQAIRESGRITQGAKWDLFVFGLLVGLINLAGFLALVIGLFATIPATMVATAYVYKKLSESTTPSSIEIAPTVTPPVSQI